MKKITTALSEKLGYDPHRPQTWSLSQLLTYAKAHHIELEPGMEKPELVKLVDEFMTNELLRNELKKQRALKEDKVDVLSTPAQTLLEYKVYPEYAAPLRANVAKLQEIIQVSMESLTSLKTIADLRNTDCHPPIEAWLFHAAMGTDDGKSFHDVLTANSSSSVCGKYFGSSDMVVRCLDCGADPTCVMCMECFQNSPCRSHRYSVNVGSGGGMCDCGDPTAWKPDSFCSKHRGLKESDDPTAGMNDADKVWVSTILRGMVQFVTLTLQQSLALDAKVSALSREKQRRKAGKAGETEGGVASDNPHPPGMEEDEGEVDSPGKEDEELAKILPYIGSPHWLKNWLSPVSKALLSLTGDCAKRMVGNLWVEPTPLPSAQIAASDGTKEASCLEIVFLFHLARGAKELRSAPSNEQWWNALVQSIGACLSDPVFRVPFAAVYLTYAERIEQCEGRLGEFAVQFMTNPITVATLMLASPSLLPYKEPHDTIIHRGLSAVVYLLVTKCYDPHSANARKLPESLPGWLFRIRWNTPKVSVQAALLLSYATSMCREAAAASVLSRSFLRAWLQLLVVLQASADVRRDPEMATGDNSDAHWISNFLSRILWHMQSAQRRLLHTLGNSDEIDDKLQKLLAVLERSKAFDPSPDRGARHKLLTSFLAGAVAPGNAPAEPSAVLPVKVGDALAYMSAYTEELLRGLDTAMVLQRTDFQKVGVSNKHVVLSRPKDPIYAYRLMEPTGHSTTFTNSLVRVYCLAVRAWVMDQRTRQLNATKDKETTSLAARVRLHGLDLTAVPGAKPPLLECTASAFAGEGNRQRRESVLDSLVMPFVLMSQLEQGWWLRGDCNAMDLMERYLQVETSFALFQDVYMLQVLAMHTPTQDYALRLLERFSYEKSEGIPDRTSRTQRPRKTARSRLGGGGGDGRPAALASLLPGWAKFFRVMLTVITDTTKANRDFSSEFSATLLRRTVTGLLAVSPSPHSHVIRQVQLCLRGLASDDEDEADKGQNLQKLAAKVISEVATAEERQGGKVYRLKDTQLWKDNVDIYSPAILDEEIDDSLMISYGRLSVLEQLKNNGGRMDEKVKTPRLPPTELRTDRQYEELVPSLRALLHTDALLVTALQVILQHAHNLRKLRAGKSGTAALATEKKTASAAASAGRPPPIWELFGGRGSTSEDEEGSSEDEEGSSEENSPKSGDAKEGEKDENDQSKHRVTPVLLLHAITAVYLCVKDCDAISQAANEEVGVAHTVTMNQASAVPDINWGRVEAYLHDTIAQTCTFNKDSVKSLFALPELTGCQCVKAKLARKLAVSRFGKPVGKPSAVAITTKSGGDAAEGEPSSQAEDQEPTYTAAEALHELRQYYHENEKEDHYSLCAMIEFILLATKLAQFSPQQSEEEKAMEAESKSHQQRVKDKQAKLLAQLRSRGAKAAAALIEPEKATKNDEGKNTGKAPVADSDEGEMSTPQVHTKLLLELTSLECCVCRNASEEPLMLLANTSTSGVLRRLSSTPLPDKRTVHSHFHVCGHAAHKTCTEKVFQRLSELWNRRMFQGEAFLGPGEFSCPVCAMVCTALCPVAVLTTSPSSPSSPTGDKATTLFEDIRKSTLKTNPQIVKDACEKLHNALAQACVGISFADEESSAIVKNEDKLQKSGSEAWQLSETIRSVGFHLQLMLEAIKAELSTSSATQHDCMALLSLLVSIDPANLARHQKVLRENYTRTREDFSLLVLTVLLEPRKTASHVAAYAAALASSSEPIQTLLGVCAPVQASESANTNEECDRAVALAVWKELGCLTLLKLMVGDEEAASSVGLVVGSRNSNGDSSSQSQQFSLVTLNTDALSTPSRLQDAIRRMWCFTSGGGGSFPTPAAASSALNATRLTQLPLLPLTSSALSPYTTPEDYRTAIVEKLLHLPSEYVEILHDYEKTHQMCSACGKRSSKPVVCCYCAKHFCLQPNNTAPELYEHSRACGGGLGLFIIVRATTFVVIDAVAGRVSPYPSVYTDEHGETDVGLVRGHRLTRSAASSSRLLTLWLRNRWSVDSATVKSSWRSGAKKM